MRIAVCRAALLCALFMGGLMSAGCCHDDGIVLRGDWSIQLSGQPSVGCCPAHQAGMHVGPGSDPVGPGPGVGPGAPGEGVEEGVSARFHPVPTAPLFRPIPASDAPRDRMEADHALPAPALEGSSSEMTEPSLPLPPPRPPEPKRPPRATSTGNARPAKLADATEIEPLMVYRSNATPPLVAAMRRVDTSWVSVEALRR